MRRTCYDFLRRWHGTWWWVFDRPSPRPDSPGREGKLEFPGGGDCILLTPVRTVVIEFKRETGGGLSAEQRECREWCEANGYAYVGPVRSLEEMIAALAELGVMPPGYRVESIAQLSPIGLDN